MPGTGGELARHLLDRFGLDDVPVEVTEEAKDHYDPADRTVRLGPTIHDEKSLTAIAVAAHEVGHAIQHAQKDASLALRTRLAPTVANISRLSVMAMSVAPVVGIITRHPVPFVAMVAIGMTGLVARVGLHVVTLPTEWDASFGKAMPIILEGNYVAPGEEHAVARVLRAAALTYAASALADILNLSRWVIILLKR